MPATLANSGSLLVIIAIVCLTIGYVFGWLISSIQHGKEDKKEQAGRDGETPKPTDALSERIGPVPPIAPAAPADGDPRPAILKLRQGENADSLVVDIAGKTVNDAAGLSLDDRAEIESALRRTANWMGLAYHLGDAAPVAVGSSPVAVPSPAAETGEAKDGLRPAAVIAGVTNALADVLQPQVKKDVPHSIVQQIDEIFQGILAGTPYETQKIYLVEDPRKGVIVRVGNDVYEGVNAVPEGEIKKMLRTAVSEWERRQEANRRRQAV